MADLLPSAAVPLQTLVPPTSAPTQALAIANRLGYPVMVRPSYVLGGRAMEIVYSDADVHRYITTAGVRRPRAPPAPQGSLQASAGQAPPSQAHCHCWGPLP